jgi:adenosylhomocysteine nucleosidase
LNAIDQTFSGTIVLFAVEREAKAFVSTYRVRQVLSPTQWLCDGRILVEMLGVGKNGARRRAQSLCASGCRPERIVVAGFAGALREGLAVGDVLAVADIVDESGNQWATGWPQQRSGRLLTCASMIGDPDLKRNLGLRHRADIVDMESSAIAEICTTHGIPFGCVRVVSDDVSKPLSQRLMGLVESGRVSIWRVLKEVMCSPHTIIELIRLAKQTRQAAERLAERLRREIG